MTIIDSQVHAYEANTPKRPWYSVPNWPDHVTGDEMVAAMDKVGVDGAIFISAFSMYRYDASYAVEVNGPIPAVSPSSSRSIRTIPRSPSRRRLEEDAGHRRNPHHADEGGTSAADDPGLDRIPRAAVRHEFPVNICAGAIWMPALRWSIATPIRVSSSTILASCSRASRPRRRKPWTDLPKVLELAKRPNAVIKVSGACTCPASRIPFPYIWDPLARVFDAWGFDRCLWGTDWTRAFAVVNYQQAVEPFLGPTRLSDTSGRC